MSGWAAGATIGASLIGGLASKHAADSAQASQQAALDANRWQGEIARDQWDDYKQNYQPLEHQMVRNAMDYDNPEHREAAASEAQAAVSNELAKAQQRLSRTVGYDPSSAAAQAAQGNLALSGAALGATTQNAARKQVQDTAYAHQLDMLGMGKGLVANASTGMANSASAAAQIAAQQQRMAGEQAAGAGMLTGNLINGLSKVNWSGFGNGVNSLFNEAGPGLNGYTFYNRNSGGNDGYTLPNGESLGS
jgi:hypothetical protein